MAGNIFISYRRSDSAKDARALYERLRREFGDNNVFIDLEGIEPGEDFVDSLERQLDGCEALVALISRDWVEARNEHGERRLDDPGDFVRIELGAAFRRGVRVFPVLIDGARTPRVSDLPEDLHPLVRRQAVVLDYSKFDADVARLARAIRKALEQAVSPHAPVAAAEATAATGVVEPVAHPSLPKTVATAVSESSVSPTAADLHPRPMGEPIPSIVAAGGGPEATAVLMTDDLRAQSTWGQAKREVQTRRPTIATVAAIAGVALFFAVLWFVHPLLFPSGALKTGSASTEGPGDAGATTSGSAETEMTGRAARNTRGAEGGSNGLSDSEAVERYRVGADLGDAKAQSSLGFMYQMGRGGLPKSDVEAVKWFSSAAKQGEPAGQLGLAEAYENGTGGLHQDHSEAIRLYRLSAAQGNPIAIVALRRLNETSEAAKIIKSIGR
jgi:hypothetical protein